MEICEADQKHIAAWLQDKCGQMRCTCCGNSQWQIAPSASLPINFDIRTTRFYYSQGMPQISVVCTNCGHILFFSPVVMGLKPDEPPAEEAPADDESV